jgi:hypothetical protein
MLPKNHDFGNTRIPLPNSVNRPRTLRLAWASEASWRHKKDSAVRNMKGAGTFQEATIRACVEAGANLGLRAANLTPVNRSLGMAQSPGLTEDARQDRDRWSGDPWGSMSLGKRATSQCQAPVGFVSKSSHAAERAGLSSSSAAWRSQPTGHFRTSAAVGLRRLCEPMWAPLLPTRDPKAPWAGRASLPSSHRCSVPALQHPHLRHL